MAKKKTAKTQKSVKLTLVQADDWEGLYVDGKVHYQGHRIPLDVVLSLLVSKTLAGYEEWNADYEWLEARGHLPDDLEDVEVE